MQNDQPRVRVHKTMRRSMTIAAEKYFEKGRSAGEVISYLWFVLFSVESSGEYYYLYSSHTQSVGIIVGSRGMECTTCAVPYPSAV